MIDKSILWKTQTVALRIPGPHLSQTISPKVASSLLNLVLRSIMLAQESEFLSSSRISLELLQADINQLQTLLHNGGTMCIYPKCCHSFTKDLSTKDSVHISSTWIKTKSKLFGTISEKLYNTKDTSNSSLLVLVGESGKHPI